MRWNRVHTEEVARQRTGAGAECLVLAFENSLEPCEVGGYEIRIADKFLVVHTRESTQRENHLTTVSVPYHPHGSPVGAVQGVGHADRCGDEVGSGPE
jgi:hypothetical protein